jgi:hypothetical protein
MDGRMRLKWSFEKWYRDMDWIDLAQDRWRDVVNTVMNLR